MTQGAGVTEHEAEPIDPQQIGDAPIAAAPVETAPTPDASAESEPPKQKKAKKKKKKNKKPALPEAPPPTVSRFVTWPRVVVAAVMVAVLVAVVILGARYVHNRRLDSARASALSAAQTYAKDFATYDYRSLDTGFARIESELTGTFKTTYTSTAQSLKATVIKYQERSTATVQAAGVTSVSPHHAVVIVLLDQTVNSVNSTTPVLNRNRASITLVRSGGGRWLMSAFDLK
jgi:Mce-associated membrane protein